MKNTLANPLTEFGIAIKVALIKRNKTQKWLIDEIKKKTNLFVDSSLLYKILIGERKASKIVFAIEEILDIKKERKTK